MAGMFEAAIPAVLGGIASTVVANSLKPRPINVTPWQQPQAQPTQTNAPAQPNIEPPQTEMPTPTAPPAAPLNPSLTAAAIRAQEEAARVAASRTQTQLATRAARDEEISVSRARLG